MVVFSKAIAAPKSAPPGDESPVPRMLRSWIFGIMLPASAVAWKVSGGSVILSTAAALAIPMFAVAQGAAGILRYRLHFGDAPLPLSPSHGVVIVSQNVERTTCHSHMQPLYNPNTAQPIRSQTTHPSPHSLGFQCGMKKAQPSVRQAATSTSFGRTTSSVDGTGGTMLGESSTSLTSISALHEDTRRPVRLLVIGDSLAIGVGQARRCTPVMPEVLAKTLSSRLGGRVVYWTCHGAPGASTGWIVRELERGVTYLENDDEPGVLDGDDERGSSSDELAQCMATSTSTSASEVQLNCSDTDDSSSDGSSVSGPHSSSSAAAAKVERAIWRERLAQHRKLFDPRVLGPYDVVVVMTGSNDLKSAFFPFLLTGEDAEFRRQAKERGGNYTKELRRLLLTLNRDMRSQLQNIRYSVGAATETVIEKVEETMERIVSSTSPVVRKLHPRSSSFREKLDARKPPRSTEPMGKSATGSLAPESSNRPASSQKYFPLVVLPGLPSRSLPIFRIAPLRWLAVPIVDILDMHKRRLAKSHPGEVLFVPPPSIDDLVEYENCSGDIWQQRCQEVTALSLRDVRRQDCRRIEHDLREYYEAKDKRTWTGEGLRKKSGYGWFRTLFSPDPAPGASIFSVDQIHPNDDGYDFWGRFIGNAIADELLAAVGSAPPE